MIIRLSVPGEPMSSMNYVQLLESNLKRENLHGLKLSDLPKPTSDYYISPLDHSLAKY